MSNYVTCIDNSGYLASLTVGAVYKVLPAGELEEGSLRVVDDSGEDYLYDPRRFEVLALANGEPVRATTLRLPAWMHGVLHAEALSSQKTVSTLLRELIAERFDLST
jgi:hypothetical protein